MSLVALDGTPLVAIGQSGTQANAYVAGAVNTLLDAANEACIMIGQVFTEDGLSHTIDTTGSSALEWRTGSTLTFANAATTVKVGLAAIDTATGPPGRAVNVANVITFDVSKSHTGGGGGITVGAWQSNVPTAGTKTIANGDLVAFAVQMTALGGVDNLQVVCGSVSSGGVIPSVTQYTGAAYSPGALLPNAVIVFNDGKYGFFYGGHVFTTTNTTQTWNNASSPNEYGNFFQMPFPAKIYGLILNPALSGDADAVLYSDPLGTPVSQKSVSMDLNVVGAATAGRWNVVLFPTPYSSTANQPLAGVLKPTSATNVSMPYRSFNVSAHQKSESLGTNCYAINRASGAFAAQNSNKDRFAIGLLVGAFEAGGTSGPAGKLVSVARGSPY